MADDLNDLFNMDHTTSPDKMYCPTSYSQSVPPILTPMDGSNPMMNNNNFDASAPRPLSQYGSVNGAGGMPNLQPHPGAELGPGTSRSPMDFQEGNGYNMHDAHGPNAQRMLHQPPSLYKSNTVKQRRLQNGVPYTIIRLPPPVQPAPQLGYTVYSGPPVPTSPGQGLESQQRLAVPTMRLRMIRPAPVMLRQAVPSGGLYRAPWPPVSLSVGMGGTMMNNVMGEADSSRKAGPGGPAVNGNPYNPQRMTLEDYLALPAASVSQSSSSSNAASDIQEIPLAMKPDESESQQTVEIPASSVAHVQSGDKVSNPNEADRSPKPTSGAVETLINSVVNHDPDTFDELPSTSAAAKNSDPESSKKSKRKKKGNKKHPRSQTSVKNLLDGCSETVFAGDDCRMHKELKTDSPCWNTVINDKLITNVEIPCSLDRVLSWDVEEVADFISRFPRVSSEIPDKFREHMIDGEALVLLVQDDLVNHLNLKLGLALKIYHSVLSVKHLKDGSGKEQQKFEDEPNKETD